MEDRQVESPPTAPGAMEYDYTNFYFGAGDDAFALLQPFDDWWQEARSSGYYLYELPIHSRPGTRIDVEDTKTGELRKGLVNFASYNYLGLSYRPEVIQAIKDAADHYGGGSSGSPILSGTTEIHQELAQEVAAFKGKEAAMIFPSGYSANVGTIGGLMRSGDLIVADQYAHASVVDGMILSKAKSRFFRHNRVDDLERKIKGFNGKKLVIVEGVYSMDGDVPPLGDILEVCRRHGARLMIDEAHSAFVYGETGRGVVEDQGFDAEVDIHLGTFSKSLGGQGGYTAGSRQLINYLRGFSRSRFFSCALSPVVVAGVRKALELATNEPELRTKLWENVAYMQKLLADAQVPIGDSTSQVIPIMVRDDARIFQMGEEIFREGVFINPVQYPAVGKHKSRFRMSISAAHSKEELEEGAAVIIRVLRRHGICP
ncbi:MAG: aminotransferase class I/II-fold pyridoxal phosphate-dependent enzyme [Gemmatimonadales bacterium]|jgi:glycine C-acetyltransferase|nr:aminotransferase class I/II-fold pyridoxal phosphate-dependent enzyme [Gemmatimonadales bacterium]MDG2240462.1 aminotransferase class I/II-fold pyridoxal phosphate-dependent enzyme [Longimicrobiales bacterium]NCG31581.1 aminotransferase class I/II-fold pyridoxal phosphate-dependent enzyme [Pseudomonadota bacterium]MBT3498489.1 aminotransferase class I/II-fold pyridoxal phosphate-dependent enzyme [Gemmatimonadales bacterium]MBT3776364.1 aminotransferase class I/II-fold pyridoxal phosphate-dep